MRNLNSSTSLYASAAMALGLCAVVLSACGGPGSSASSPSALPPTSRDAAPFYGSDPTPIAFKYATVNDPDSDYNEVTGINQLSKITGLFGGGSGSNVLESYTSEPTYYKFRGANYPGAQGTVATTLTSNKILAGYVIEPPSLKGTWAFVRYHGIWALLKDHSEGGGVNAVTEVLGMNDSEIGVGYYLTNTGAAVPFVVNVVTQQFTNLKPPGAVSAEATGISGRGDITGWAVTSAKKTEGFFLRLGTYYFLNYPGAKATEALGVNWQRQVVGTYEDSGGVWHGFVMSNPMDGYAKQVWQKVDDPAADGVTQVTGINNHDDICGWYVDGSGDYDGFVATPGKQASRF